MKNIKEQLLIVKNEAPEIFAAVIASGADHAKGFVRLKKPVKRWSHGREKNLRTL